MPFVFVCNIATLEKRYFLKGRTIDLFAKAHGLVVERFVPRKSCLTNLDLLLYKQELFESGDSTSLIPL